MLTVREVSLILNVCVSHVYDLISDGAIRSIRIGRSVRISRSELESFISDLSDCGSAELGGSDGTNS